jgi:hypothetical protein
MSGRFSRDRSLRRLPEARNMIAEEFSKDFPYALTEFEVIPDGHTLEKWGKCGAASAPHRRRTAYASLP